MRNDHFEATVNDLATSSIEILFNGDLLVGD
jgi:hypothetical protein